MAVCGDCAFFRHSRGHCGHVLPGMTMCYSFTNADHCPFFAKVVIKYHTATTTAGSVVRVVNGREVD